MNDCYHARIAPATRPCHRRLVLLTGNFDSESLREPPEGVRYVLVRLFSSAEVLIWSN